MVSTSNVILSTFLFVVAGLLEIGGGWLVWQTLREGRPWWWALLGSAVLVGYGIVPCYQPADDEGTSNFSRVYAIYGGYFILLALLWGWGVDGRKPDLGDTIGACVAISGSLIMYFWPRKS